MTTNLLKHAKRASLSLLHRAGVFSLVAQTPWRKRKLLILGYHGISINDEHEWNPFLYFSPALFEERLQILAGANVLPLNEALRRLADGTLPEKAVAITIDDGFSDFYLRGWPLLSKYGLPATVYQTTYYSQYGRPVFGLICSYMLWKKRGEVSEGYPIPGWNGPMDLRTETGRANVLNALERHARLHRLSARQKEALAAQLAARLEINYEALVERRILQLMTPSETQELAGAGCDIQLHTHRHSTPCDKALFAREIAANRGCIEASTGLGAIHFSYPNGHTSPEFLPWLAELGVSTAATSNTGLVGVSTERLLLPRLLDHSGLSSIEFKSWVAGIAVWLPRRSILALDSREDKHQELSPELGYHSSPRKWEPHRTV